MLEAWTRPSGGADLDTPEQAGGIALCAGMTCASQQPHVTMASARSASTPGGPARPGVLCSALIAVAFGHHVAAQQPAAAHTGNGGASNSSGGSFNGGASTGGSSSSTSGGSSSSTSGGSSSTSGGGTSNQGQGTIVVPAQPPAPASGGGQVTSGAS